MQLPDAARTVVQHLISQSDVEDLHRHLNELGDKCRTMIMLWGEGYSDDEIAQTMTYNSAAVAKTSRLRCLDKLRERYRIAP
jgi:RNA polymerase sigma-70 factor (ECF subfamily)